MRRTPILDSFIQGTPPWCINFLTHSSNPKSFGLELHEYMLEVYPENPLGKQEVKDKKMLWDDIFPQQDLPAPLQPVPAGPEAH